MEAVEDRPEEEKRGWDAKEGQDGTRVRGRVWAGASGSLVSWGPDPRLPGDPLAPLRRVRSLPTPHSPARVSGKTRTPERRKRRVRGLMTRILWVWEAAESGQVGGDFVIGIRGDADWFF